MEDWQSFITKNIPRPNKHPPGLSSQVGSGSGQPDVYRRGQLWQAAFLICAPICSAPLPTALCPWDKIQNIWRTPLQMPSIVFYAAADGCHQIIIWVIINHNPTMSWRLRGLALLKWSLVRSTYPTCTCSAFLWPFAHCQHVLQKAINAARMPFEPGQAVPSSPQLARQNCAAHTSQKIQTKQSNELCWISAECFRMLWKSEASAIKEMPSSRAESTSDFSESSPPARSLVPECARDSPYKKPSLHLITSHYPNENSSLCHHSQHFPTIGAACSLLIFFIHMHSLCRMQPCVSRALGKKNKHGHTCTVCVCIYLYIK